MAQSWCEWRQHQALSASISSMQINLTIATRESRLALWQAHHVSERIQAAWGRSVSLLGLTTLGDQILDVSLSKIGGKGLFVKELEAALLDGRADLAVHSLKDVPMDLPEGFTLAAILEREDPRDAWVSGRYPVWQALPQGSVVGTSSLRRLVQLRALRPDLDIQPLRGNLDTRLRKLDEGQFDGIVLAAAGLKRLGLAQRIGAFFDTDTLLPCAGQGALGIEVRSDQHALIEQLCLLSHPPTRLATLAERAVSRALGGSCSIPLAAHAVWTQGQLRLQALLGHAQQPQAALLRAQNSAPVSSDVQALALGEQVAQDLRDCGAADYLALTL